MPHNRGRWITPDSAPVSTRCWRVVLPDSIDCLASFKGAVDELRYSSNWEQLSGISPEDAAALFASSFDSIQECFMIGAIIAYATTNPPAGTLACDGASYLRVDYPLLYAALASPFISDSDHFVVPDLRGRSVVGIGTGTGLTTRAMNDGGGEETHTLVTSEMPSHSHTEGIAVPVFVNGGLEAPASSAVPGTGFTGSSGGDGAHQNMHPFLSLGYAIVAE